MKHEIRNRFTGNVQFTAEIDCKDDASVGVKIGLAVKWAVKTGANLYGANLSGAYLSGAYLSGANLSGADLSRANLYGANLSGAYLSGAYLSGANLSGADLSRADLSGAYLSGAYLSGAYLSGANLSGAYLSGAYLSGANLSGADLSGAYLSGAYLSGANLSGADLSGADLSRANLYGADLPEDDAGVLALKRTRILPDGDLIGWKKCSGGVIVKMLIPADARRSHAFGRKCRAEFADVLDVIGDEVGVSLHGMKIEYRVGQRVTPHEWCDDWREECAGGIHFYITREEAEAHT